MSTAALSPTSAGSDSPSSVTPGAPGSRRIESIDIVRGAVMVLMAIDHVRVYSGLPAGGPTPGIFFTRWVTHFCAPAFIFLAGTSAYLHGRKRGDPRALARFLALRGAWLILLELTVLRLGWTFNLDFAQYLLAGVIWVIGWCMIVLATLVRLPLATVATVALVIIAGHNVMDAFTPQVRPALGTDGLAWLWQTLYYGGPIRLGEAGPTLFVLYALVPWVGVMAAGYAFGAVMLMAPDRRRGICLAVGLGATAAFLVLRGFNLYGNPTPWDSPASRYPAALAFLNTNKYPASLQFLLMTLGPTIALLPALERTRGWLAGALTVFGRVPFFYYALHIPLIHALALIVSLARTGTAEPWLLANHPVMVPPAPEGYTWTLGLLYLVTGLAVIALYFPCRWFAGVKQRRRERWLSFL